MEIRFSLTKSQKDEEREKSVPGRSEKNRNIYKPWQKEEDCAKMNERNKPQGRK